MTVDEIQDIIDYAYPRIKKYYGKGKLNYPKIELWNDIYARLSGDPEARGEASKSTKAQYDEETNIMIIKKKLKTNIIGLKSWTKYKIK